MELLTIRRAIYRATLISSIVALALASGTSARAGVTFGAPQSDTEATITGLDSDALDTDFEPGDGPDLILARNACKDPKFPLVCVKQGDSATLGVKETCKRNGKRISCGKVHWEAKANTPGIDLDFSPDPGDPSTETVSAKKTLKPGTYQQSITVKCSKVPSCVGGTATIIVLK